MRRILPILVLMVAATVASPSQASGGGAPLDYRDLSGLSEPTYETVRERIQIPTRDGTKLYAEVVRPDAPGGFATILELSPYNGGVDSRTGGLPGDGVEGGVGGLAGYFAPRGYAVVLADLRGTGNSEGCMDYMGAVDRLDAYDLIGRLGAQPWSNGRVGMTGVSYVGSTPTFAAAMRPPALKTIVPVAGLAQMYDHQFQAGVPYYLQWAGAAGAYDVALTNHPANQDDPGWARNVASFGCGVPNSAAANHADLLTGRYTEWHQERDFREAAIAADIPVFMVQGFRDGSVRPVAMEWFTRRTRPGDKAWFGQWGHQASNRGEQFRGALHRWFDKHLQERDVDTGPPVEVFLNDGIREAGEIYETVPAPVRTAQRWPGPTAPLTLHAWPDGTLRAEPAPASSVLSPVDPRGGGAIFMTEPFAEDVEIAGFPDTTIQIALPDGRRIDVFAVLFDHGIAGRTKVTQAAMNPELRNGLGVVAPILPGETYTLKPPTQPLDYLVRAGNRLELKITSHDGDKVPLFPGPGVFQITLGGSGGTGITLPTVANPAHYPDPKPRG